MRVAMIRRGLIVTLMATVIITITESTLPVGCSPPQPVLIKQADGNYVRSYPIGINLTACFSSETKHQEEWTDYPERGGTFIRTLPQ